MIASFTLTMMQYNILCTVKRFEVYETIGALFRQATAGTLELSVADRIWELIMEKLINKAQTLFYPKSVIRIARAKRLRGNRTLKASTLSNRGYERSEHLRTVVSNKCTALQRSARTPSSATPSGSFHWIGSQIRGCSQHSYPRLLRVDAFSVLLPLGF